MHDTELQYTLVDRREEIGISWKPQQCKLIQCPAAMLKLKQVSQRHNGKRITADLEASLTPVQLPFT